MLAALSHTLSVHNAQNRPKPEKYQVQNQRLPFQVNDLKALGSQLQHVLDVQTHALAKAIEQVELHSSNRNPDANTNADNTDANANADADVDADADADANAVENMELTEADSEWARLRKQVRGVCVCICVIVCIALHLHLLHLCFDIIVVSYTCLHARLTNFGHYPQP